MKYSLLFILALGLGLLARAEPGCVELTSPAPLQSGTPRLHTAPDGTVYLMFAGPGLQTGERAIWLSTLPPGGREWSKPLPVVSTPLLLENWADFGTLVVADDGQLWVQWFQGREGGQRGYSGWLARSRDGGHTWTKSAPLGHEFISLAPLSDGRVMAVWLQSTRPPRPPGEAPPARAPRDPHADHHHGPARDPHAPYTPSMRLNARLLAPNGTTLREWVVDPDVCTCCQTTLAVLPGDGLLVSYRGHTRDEVRDNWIALFDGQAWGEPAVLHPDGWIIPACPVNGPAASAHGDTMAIVWFTAAGGVSRVSSKFSSDAGRTLGPALPLDLGRPMGRVDCVMLPDQRAVSSWLEAKSAGTSAGIYLRTFNAAGLLSKPWLVAETSQARASGFPRLALRADGNLVLAYTEEGTESRIRTLLLSALPVPAEPALTLEAMIAPAPQSEATRQHHEHAH